MWVRQYTEGVCAYVGEGVSEVNAEREGFIVTADGQPLLRSSEYDFQAHAKYACATQWTCEL